MARPTATRRRSQSERCGYHTRHRAVWSRAVGHEERARAASAMYPFCCMGDAVLQGVHPTGSEGVRSPLQSACLTHTACSHVMSRHQPCPSMPCQRMVGRAKLCYVRVRTLHRLPASPCTVARAMHREGYGSYRAAHSSSERRRMRWSQWRDDFLAFTGLPLMHRVRSTLRWLPWLHQAARPARTHARGQDLCVAVRTGRAPELTGRETVHTRAPPRPRPTSHPQPSRQRTRTPSPPVDAGARADR